MRKPIFLVLIISLFVGSCFASQKSQTQFLQTHYFIPIPAMAPDTIISAMFTVKQIVVPDSIQNKYLGTYRMTMDKSRTMRILKEENLLIARYGNDIVSVLKPKSSMEFIMQGIQPEAIIKFIFEKGKVTKYIVYQNGPYEWKKIK